MPAELIAPETLTAADLAAWAELAATAAEPNPFFEAPFVLGGLKHLGGTGVALLAVREGKRFTALLPVQRRWRRVGPEARLGRLPGPTLVGWMHTHCFLGTPLLGGEDPEAAAAALLGAAFARGAGAAWLGFPMMARDGAVAAAFDAAVAGRGLTQLAYEHQERAALFKRPQDDYVTSHLSSKRRRELVRLRKQLAKELGGELEVADVSADPAAAEAFMDMEHAGWKGREGTSFRSVAGHPEFFRAMCDGFRADGRLQLLELSANGRTVAMKCNVRSGAGIFCFKIAHDESESIHRFSPGVQLELSNVDVFHEDAGAGFSDSCAAPDNQMINRLWPDRRTVATAIVPAGRVRGAATGVLLAQAIRFRERRSTET